MIFISEMIFLLLLLLIFLGLFIGLAVGRLAEEELRPGMHYFEWMRGALLLAIIAVFFITNPSKLFIILTALMLVLFSFSREREALYYSSLGMILYLSWNFNGFAIIAPLVFLYGFPEGTIYLYAHIKEHNLKLALGLFLKNLSFLLVGLMFFFSGLVL